MGKRKPETELVIISNKYELTAPQRKGLETILSASPNATQEELAVQIGVRRETVNVWLHMKNFLDAMHDAANLIIQSEWPKVIQTGLREALDGDIQWAKWLGELAGYYSPKAELKHTGEVGIKSVSELLDRIAGNGKVPDTRRVQRTLKN